MTEHSQTKGKPFAGFSLRMVIMTLVLANAAAVALITVAMGVSTNNRSITTSSAQATQKIVALAVSRQADASRYISDQITSYFAKVRKFWIMFHWDDTEISPLCSLQMYSAAQSIASVIERGVIMIGDTDALVPFLGTVMRNIGIADTNAMTIASHMPRNAVSLFPGDGTFVSGSYKLIYSVWTTNLTCQRMCPVAPSTNGSLYFYGIDPANFTILGSTTAFPYNYPVAKAETFSKITKGVTKLDDPSIVGDIIFQQLRVPLFDAGAINLGTVEVTVTIEFFSDYLNVVKKSTTENTLFYILSTKAQVLAMSGFSNQSEASQTLKKVVDPLLGISSLKTIFEFDRDTYPLLNVSAKAVLELSRGNLSNMIPDTTWTLEGNVFRASSLTIYGYEYILVSGAPLSDYVGDIIQLKSNLEADGSRSMLIVVLSALAVVIILAILSLLFAWYYITHPLAEILVMMKKATKFDFSDIRNGLGTSKRSVVREIHTTQANFIEMIKVFAEALKQNKALLQRKPTTDPSQTSPASQPTQVALTRGTTAV
ncbi:hypothetical protein HDU93_001196 [Gonapodya sp. JEL0774]|nr:hypothetical protein HDU93_001196 [Gonapodya sp. JEL0774]